MPLRYFYFTDFGVHGLQERYRVRLRGRRNIRWCIWLRGARESRDVGWRGKSKPLSWCRIVPFSSFCTFTSNNAATCMSASGYRKRGERPEGRASYCWTGEWLKILNGYWIDNQLADILLIQSPFWMCLFLGDAGRRTTWSAGTTGKTKSYLNKKYFFSSKWPNSFARPLPVVVFCLETVIILCCFF